MENRSPTRRVKVGVIGCGQVARSVHLPTLQQLPDTEVVALAETDAQRLAAASQLVPGAIAMTNYLELLDRNDVEAVVICVPTALHAPVAIEAMRRQKHVYVEKPVGMDLEDGQHLLRVWRAAGVVGAVGFNYRFNPLNLEARALLSAGKIGRVVAVRSVFCTMQDTMPAWKRSRGSGGGALLDLASHEIDLARFLLGEEVAAVFADVRSLRTGGDTALLQLRMGSGIPVQSVVTLGSAEDSRLDIYGDRGRIEVRRYDGMHAQLIGVHAPGRMRTWMHSAGALRGFPYWFKKVRSPVRELSFVAALAAFARAVCGKPCPELPTLLDGYRSLAVVVAAEDSGRTGSAVAPARDTGIDEGIMPAHVFSR